MALLWLFSQPERSPQLPLGERPHLLGAAQIFLPNYNWPVLSSPAGAAVPSSPWHFPPPLVKGLVWQAAVWAAPVEGTVPKASWFCSLRIRAPSTGSSATGRQLLTSELLQPARSSRPLPPHRLSCPSPRASGGHHPLQPTGGMGQCLHGGVTRQTRSPRVSPTLHFPEDCAGSSCPKAEGEQVPSSSLLQPCRSPCLPECH